MKKFTFLATLGAIAAISVTYIAYTFVTHVNLVANDEEDYELFHELKHFNDLDMEIDNE